MTPRAWQVEQQAPEAPFGLEHQLLEAVLLRRLLHREIEDDRGK